TLHWDIYPQLNIVKIPLKKLFSLVLTIQILLLKESSLYNKKTIIKKLINLYAKQKDITAIENLLKEIDTISERIQKKELINECKIEIYRLLVRREIELSDYIEQYITKT
ncbi:hypothetical protein, partial [Turicibacter sanguinis]|uniref:hypothetical protein n=1 Tax=Turicibacter sanguinis TaxID=154288 RepID=UPI0021D4A18B